MGVSLVESIAAWKKIVAYYQNNLPNTPIPEVNRRQALLPRGARLLENDRGTAPGIIGRVGNCRVICMPGVPHEMFAMLDRVEKALTTWYPSLRPPTIGEVWFAGIGESTAQEHIGDLLSEQDPQVGITVSEHGHITLCVVGAAEVVSKRVSALKHVLKPWLLPAPGVAASLVRVLSRRKLTIATAESCTCGQVVAKLGAVAGTSAMLRESIVAYHPQVKTQRLGVTAATIRRHGIVSETVAATMAQGMRVYAKADYAIATTGVAGPSGGTAAIPVGTVCLAVADAKGVITRMIRVRGGRERVQTRAAAHALILAYEVVVGRVRTKATRPD
jgi:nicotinamide-nucleotide amidase